MEKKRLDSVNIKKFIYDGNNLEAEFEFNITHKNAFCIMDRKIIQNSIILKYYNGKIDFVITALYGIQIMGFNLKRKHIKDMMELLEPLKEEYKEVDKVINKLNENIKKKNIICIMGKSGCGKSTAMIGLTNKNNNYYMVKSFTTREERENDPNDKLTHIFSNNDKYELDSLERKTLALYESPKGYKSWVTDECFRTGKINLYAIDYKEFLNFKNNKNYNVIGIYIDIDEEERQKRLKIREPDKIYDKEEHLNRISESNDDNCFSINVTNEDRETVENLIEEIINKTIKK